MGWVSWVMADVGWMVRVDLEEHGGFGGSYQIL